MLSAHTSVEKQVRELASVYKRHGGKGYREQRVKKLVRASKVILDRFGSNEIHQIGQKQIKWFFNEYSKELAASTRKEFWYAFSLLWKLLNRHGEPACKDVARLREIKPSIKKEMEEEIIKLREEIKELKVENLKITREFFLKMHVHR